MVGAGIRDADIPVGYGEDFYRQYTVNYTGTIMRRRADESYRCPRCKRKRLMKGQETFFCACGYKIRIGMNP